MVHDAMKEYTQAAFEILTQACSEALPTPLPIHEWTRTSDQPDCFERHQMQRPWWESCIASHRETLHSLQEWHQLVRALRADPNISPLLDTLVGTFLGSHGNLTTEAVSDRLIHTLASARDGFFWNEEEFELHFAEFNAGVRSLDIPIVLVAPLLAPQVPTLPLPLEPDVELDHMTDDEVSRCLQCEVLISSWGPESPFVALTSDVAVRVRYHLPRVVGGRTDDNIQRVEQERREHAVAKVENVIKAFRLFEDGALHAPGYLAYPSLWPYSLAFKGFSLPANRRIPLEVTYELQDDQLESFQAFYANLTPSVPEVVQAVTKFAHARSLPDLYIVHELIKKLIKDIPDFNPSISRNEIERFTRTANLERHRSGKFEPPPNLMPYEEGERFIRDLLCQAPGIPGRKRTTP
jgi:hypothetical protein